MYRNFLLIVIAVALIFGGYLLVDQSDDFGSLDAEAMHARIIEERDFAIGQAVARGDYHCCINPPCTMCYMDANKWNNFTAGTCACDDLIVQGKEACPQCQRGLSDIHNEENTFCDANATAATCDSINVEN